MRGLYAWALPRGMATFNPTAGLRLPAGGKAWDRIATPAEARTLIAAVDPGDQAALGLAVYAGLRLGEVLALDWSRIDLDGGTLRVERAWDHGALEFVAPKSEAGTRTVPIVERLAMLLADHRVLTDHRDGLLFTGRDPERPPSVSALVERMARRWHNASRCGSTKRGTPPRACSSLPA
jgi:integrase